MDVCILSDTDAWGGAEVHTVGLADVLARRGHRVSIVALGDDVFRPKLGPEGRPGVRVHKPTLAKPIYRMGYWECAALVKGLPGDVCVLVRLGVQAGSLMLDLAARRRFGRYIAIEHTCAEMERRTSRRHLFGLVPGLGLWWYKIWFLWQFRSMASSRVVCVSEAARDRLVRGLRLPRNKVLAVRNGIDADRFRPNEAHRATSRKAWGASDNTVVLGAVGRLSPEKGLDDAVSLFGRLAALRPDREMLLVLVGDGSERDRLQKLAAESGAGARVVFPGFTSRPWEAHCGLDVHLQPSREEAMPLALLEAMACECCPVAMNVGGVPEVLAGSGAGWLVPAGDRDAFLAAMDAATGMDPERRRERGRAARRHVESRFNGAAQYEALAKVIEQG